MVDDRLTILIAARDEEARIGATIAELAARFPGVEVIVADDGSRDSTAHAAAVAGARVLRLPHRGKGQALTLAERAAAPGRLLLCDADLRGDLTPLVEADGDLVVAGVLAQAGRRLRAREGIRATADPSSRQAERRVSRSPVSASSRRRREPRASRSRPASASRRG